METSNVSGTANSSGQLQLGNGAQFWVYLSPQNDTSKMISTWRVTFSQGNWSDFISSENPTKQIQTPNLSGIFDIKVELLSGSTGTWRQIPPQQGSNNEIGCNSNCASMVGIVADSMNPFPGAINAHFWTTWDAMCKAH
ncbi:hypothetical protein ACM46_09420 [Chryseobacterium angstadtii]|uniref:Uncharacterized protein n=1 Tax=Chryseobacterium angstadtii TaxID=558151 RepID=A0A0J7L5X0_9FLAO|nr:hypothetical protein [Chryseobacterium angstadtii]KMQ64480.1 hypothetical protein ACM46_09420 [Chryseobacterium angstadtii]